MDARSVEIADVGCCCGGGGVFWDEDCAPDDPDLLGVASFANDIRMSSRLVLLGCGSGFLPISASRFRLLGCGSCFPPKIAARFKACDTCGSFGSGGFSIPNSVNTSGATGGAIPGFSEMI